jgi:signal transduction histidine kinase
VIGASLILLAAVSVALGLWVWSAGPSRQVNRWFAAHTFSLAGWVIGIAGLNSGMSPEPWSRLAFASASLIPWSFLGFARNYPSEGTWPPRRLLSIALTAGIGFAALSTFSALVVHDISLTALGPDRKAGPLYIPFAMFILAGSILPLGVFWIKWRDARGQERAQLQYLGAGLLILGVGALGANLLLPLLAGHSRYSWLGPFFLVPLLALVGHAIIRHRLMDLRFVIHQGLVRVLITALLSLVAVLFTRTVSSATHSEVQLPLDVVVATAVVLMSLSSPVQAMFARFIDPYLHRGGTDYGAALRIATHRLTRLMNPEQLATELQNIFETQLAPEQFVLLIRRKDRAEFEVSDEFSRQLPLLLGLSENLNEPSASALALNTALINTGSNPDIGGGLHGRLRDAGVAVAVLLGRRGERFGLMLLGPRKSGDAYFRDDLIFIESVAELTSIALENGLLYGERVAILEYSERLLEVLDAAVVATDADGHITRYNQAARELLTLDPNCKNLSIAQLPPHAAWALALALRGHWQPHDVEFVVDHVNRGRVPVIASTTILHEGRTVVGGILVITDLSTVKALAANQRRLEHLATMARFYAGIAHEIRSPLTAISNFVSLLRDRFDDPEYRETVSRLLPLEVNRIVGLAERLRLMAPSEEGQLSSVDLRSLLRDIVRLQIPVGAEAAKVTLTCPEALPHILGDPRQLTQLFLNLLNNAREAMGRGGNISIAASSEGSDQDTSVVVRVSDEGSGIDPRIAQKVFEPFFTTKVAGTGLGLSICREIAEFHGASLTLRRRDEHPGTIAEVRFSTLASSTVALRELGDGLSKTSDPPPDHRYSPLRRPHSTGYQR